MKKLFTLPTALLMGLSASLGFGAAAPAQAIPGGCSIVMPSKVTIAAPYTRVPARLGADCAASRKDYASWTVNHDYYGEDDILIFDTGQNTAVWEFYDYNHLGSYHVRPSYSWDVDSNDLPQNTLAMSVRLGSRLTLTTTRKGRFVTLRSTATRFTPSADRFRPWTSKPVNLYRRPNATAPWRYFRQVRTNKNGQISVRLQSAAPKYYQARTTDIGNTWGRVSAAKRR